MCDFVSTRAIDFCIVGAQKAGSSSLASFLGATPALIMPRYEKSIFESPYFENGAVDIFLNSVNAFDENKKIGIKRPDYLMDKSVPRRLYEHNSQIRIIIVLRNRFKRFVSAAFWYMQVGEIPVCDINALIEKLFNHEYSELSAKEKELLDYGKYADGIKNYLDEIEAKNILVIEDKYFYANVSQVHKQVCMHIGLDEQEVSFSGMALKKIKPAVYSKPRLKYLGFINKHFFYVSDKNQSLNELRPTGVRGIYYILKSLDVFIFSKIFANEVPEISRKNRRKVNDYFLDDVQRLSAIKSEQPKLKFYGCLPT